MKNRQYICHILVLNAIETGHLIPLPCEVCGIYGENNKGRRLVEAHHDDYLLPLDVRWLCKRHHKQWHAKNTAKNFLLLPEHAAQFVQNYREIKIDLFPYTRQEKGTDEREVLPENHKILLEKTQKWKNLGALEFMKKS